MTPLTPAERERVSKLIEECAEVIQIACKCLRHGYNSYHPDKPNGLSNKEELERECGDVRFSLILLTESGDLDKNEIHLHAVEKAKEVQENDYLHHQSDKLLKAVQKACL